MRFLRMWPVVLTGAAVAAIVLSGRLHDAEAQVRQAVAGASSATQPDSAASYNLKRVRLQNGVSTVVRWNPCQTAITYRVNLEGLPAQSRTGALATIRTGMKKLAAANGLHYRYSGETSYVPRKDAIGDAPAEIVIAVVGRKRTDISMADSTLGFGGVIWTTWSGGSGYGAAVVRGFAILNADSFTDLKPGFGRGNTDGTLLLHELGHATGLEHVGDPRQIMDPDLTNGSPAGYGEGDRTALERVGLSAGCLTIPRGAGLPDLN